MDGLERPAGSATPAPGERSQVPIIASPPTPCRAIGNAARGGDETTTWQAHHPAQALAEALERWLPRRAWRREEVPARPGNSPGSRMKPPPVFDPGKGMNGRLMHDEGWPTPWYGFMADCPRRSRP